MKLFNVGHFAGLIFLSRVLQICVGLFCQGLWVKLSDTYEVSLGQDTSDYWTNEVLYLMIRGS